MTFKTVASRIPNRWLTFTTSNGKLLLKRNVWHLKKFVSPGISTLIISSLKLKTSPRRREKI